MFQCSEKHRKLPFHRIRFNDVSLSLLPPVAYNFFSMWSRVVQRRAQSFCAADSRSFARTMLLAYDQNSIGTSRSVVLLGNQGEAVVAGPVICFGKYSVSTL